MEKITIKSNGRVLLILSDNSYKPVRKIGYIKDRTFYTKRNLKGQVFNKFGDGAGINYKFVSEYWKHFDLITVEVDSILYETSREYFLKNGYIRQYHNLDKQIYLPFESFGMDKVKAWEQQEAGNNKFEIISKQVTKLKIQMSLF